MKHPFALCFLALSATMLSGCRTYSGPPTVTNTIETITVVDEPLCEGYVVKEGDTLSGIALKHQERDDIVSIINRNNITDPSSIRAGQELQIMREFWAPCRMKVPPVDPRREVTDADKAAIQGILETRQDLLVGRAYESMQYVIRLPGGLTTNWASVNLVDKSDSRCSWSIGFQKDNGEWTYKSSQPFFGSTGLLGNVPFKTAEHITQAVWLSETYGQGHYLSLIIAPDSGHFAMFDTPLPRTDFMIELEPTPNAPKSREFYNTRRVSVDVEDLIIHFLDKKDSWTIN